VVSHRPFAFRLSCPCWIPRARCARWPAVTREASRSRTRGIVAGIEPAHNAHLEVVTQDRQRRLEMLEARTVAQAQQAIDLGHVPSQASREFRLAHAGIPHRFVELDLRDRQNREMQEAREKGWQDRGAALKAREEELAQLANAEGRQLCSGRGQS